jgi:hypothetical protein
MRVPQIALRSSPSLSALIMVGMTVRLDPDFSEFIELLLANEVVFMVVGGYAVAAHGHPRYTGDLDIWLLIDRDNAEKLVDVLREFGFGGLDLSADDFLVENQVVQLGREPMRIDLLTGLDGVSFSDCVTRAVSIDVDGLPVPFISREDLLENKRSSGRSQDLADVEALEARGQ